MSTSVSRAGQLRSYIEGFWGTWLLHVGRQLGLFEALRQGPLTAAQLSERCGYEAAYTEVWCRAGQAYEFLEKAASGAYQIAPGWEELLEGGAAWATTYIQVSQRVHETLEAVFQGKAFPEPPLSLRLMLSEGLKASYAWLWKEFAPSVPVLQDRLNRGKRLIEFGCGPGYGLEQVRASHPELEITGIEEDYDCAREAERITKAVIVVGTAEECRYDSRFDVAVFHRALAACSDPPLAIARAAECLRSGGVLVITSEAEIPDQEPPGGALRSSPRLRLGERFFYQMFLAQDALRSISMLQIQEWCQAEGLQVVELAAAPENGSPTLVCKKP